MPRRISREISVGVIAGLALSVTAASAGAEERYPGFGIVLEIGREQRSVVISHQDIPGFMDAMTMSFPVRDPKVLADVPVNAMVDFTVVADAEEAYVEDVRVHRFASSEQQPQNAQRLQLIEALTATAPAIKALEVGQAVPDFSLIDQKERAVKLSDFAGKVVAVSFMYTRCRLANYCFRLSNNLSLLQKRFGAELGKDLVLLTITFDPTNDGPESLARYASAWKAHPDAWRFLTGPEEDVRRVCHLFGMSFWPDMGMITHTMHTVVVDRDGRVAANLEGNEFTPKQLGDLVQSVMDHKKKLSSNF